jgi:hypothetical protein
VQLVTVIVVAAVAAGTFVLSYAGVHAIALQSGVSAALSRYYPGVFDAVLVIACAAAPLQNARWWTRLYTWLVILIVVGLLGAMDAVHAMNVALPRRELAGTVAVLPWVLLLLGFTLWLVILRHFRVQQSSHDTPVTPATPATPSAEAHNVPAAVAAGPGGRPAVATLPAAAGFTDEAPAQEPEPEHGPDEEGLVPGLRAEGSPESPAEEEVPLKEAAPEEEAPEEGTPEEEVPEEGTPEEEAPAGDEARPEAEASLEATYWDDGDHGDEESGPDEEAEVGGIPHATGPRLRRIRSLPATPVDDE